MEKQSNTMQCIPSFFVSLDKIANFVKSVIVTDWDWGVQAKWTPEPVQIVPRDRIAS
jgi:hypothetical protein